MSPASPPSFSKAPLSGQRVLGGQRVIVTRAAHQASKLTACFERLGAEVLPLPLLEIHPPKDPRAIQTLEDARAELSKYSWVLFTSTNAVHAFLGTGDTSPLEVPPGTRIGAVGTATAKALAALAVPPPLQPEQQDAEGLLRALLPKLEANQRILLPQAADARPTLAHGLREAGYEVDTVTAYDKGLPSASRSLAATILAQGPIGWVTFTSPRIVRHFLEVLPHPTHSHLKDRLSTLKAASIGPITSAELKRHDIPPTAQALQPNDDALAAAVADAMAR